MTSPRAPFDATSKSVQAVQQHCTSVQVLFFFRTSCIRTTAQFGSKVDETRGRPNPSRGKNKGKSRARKGERETSGMTICVPTADDEPTHILRAERCRPASGRDGVSCEHTDTHTCMYSCDGYSAAVVAICADVVGTLQQLTLLLLLLLLLLLRLFHRRSISRHSE